MPQISLCIPDDVLAALRLSQKNPDKIGGELLMLAAAKLYEMGRLSSGTAAQLAGIPRTVFLARLVDYGVNTFDLTEDDLQRDGSRILQGAREALAIARGEMSQDANALGRDASPAVPWKVEAIKLLSGYRLEVTFADGLHGVVDLSHIPHTGVFAVWDELGYFEKAIIDPETWTVCWPNGEDVAPDAMYEEVKKQQGEGA